MFFASSYKREIIRRRRRRIKKCSERENRVRVPCAEFVFPYKEKTRWVLTRANISFFLSLFLWFSSRILFDETQRKVCVYRLDREMALWRNRICLLAFRNCEKDANGRKWSSLVGPAFPCRLVLSANIIFDYFQLFSSQKEREREKEKTGICKPRLIPPDVDRPVRWVLFHFILFKKERRGLATCVTLDIYERTISRFW